MRRAGEKERGHLEKERRGEPAGGSSGRCGVRVKTQIYFEPFQKAGGRAGRPARGPGQTEQLRKETRTPWLLLRGHVAGARQVR